MEATHLELSLSITPAYMSEERRNWSRAEVEAVVADYFDMYAKYLSGIAFKKSDHWRALQPQLDDRTRPSIEFKYRNISAALIELGRPYLPGYVPATNRQDLLFEVVEHQVRLDSAVTALLHNVVSQPVTAPSLDDILTRLTHPPRKARSKKPFYARERRVRPRSTVDFLAAEIRNSALGRAGEDFVLKFEVARLLSLGGDQWAKKVEHVAVTRGDHEGYDILSFDVSGRERLIEVKTTAFGDHTPFFVSTNQVELSRRESDKFHLYRPYDFRTDPRLYHLPGALHETCDLEPSEFSAMPKAVPVG